MRFATACGRIRRVVLTIFVLGNVVYGSGFGIVYDVFSSNPGTYYVSKDGDDGLSGDRDAPWRTLGAAAQRAGPGDEVVLLPGEFEGVFRLRNSGTEDAPIVLRADERRTARLLGGGAETAAVELVGVEHVRIEGLEFNTRRDASAWVRVEDSEFIEIEDCLMEEAYATTGMRITGSRNVWVRDSVMRRNSFNMMVVSHSEGIVFEGNGISRAPHSPLMFWPHGTNRRIVLRGNVFHPGWGRALEVFGGNEKVLFEDNILTHSLRGGRARGSTSKFAAVDGIFRFSRVFRNRDAPLHLYPAPGDVAIDTVRFYHNVFDDNLNWGVRISGAGIHNVEFKNNVFSRNDTGGAGDQVITMARGADWMRFRGNALGGKVTVGREPRQPSEVDGERWAADQEAQFEGNYGPEASPEYEDPENYVHSLGADSPLRGGGMVLTRTREAGSGRELPVEDAAYFYDGYGIPGETGDRISVGGRMAVVEAVDREGRRLHLDRSFSWERGEAVGFASDPERPDVGPYDYGENAARPGVEVVARPFSARPGEVVELEARLRGGGSPVTAEWWPGDGNRVQAGAVLSHRYKDSGDYPVRVRVTDEAGRVYRGAFLVEVRSDEQRESPVLLRHTFGPEDETWWWNWHAYSPMPAAWERVVVLDGPEELPIPLSMHPSGRNRFESASERALPEGKAWFRVYAPEDGAPIPASIRPGYWAIDRHPYVHLRYRVEPGTPVGVRVRAFDGPGLQERVRWLAVSPEVRRNGTSEVPGNALELTDDGEWREAVLDVREIRQDYPDLAILQSLEWQGLPSAEVREDDAYAMERVQIGAEREWTRLD